jgi:hypothetical protein
MRARLLALALAALPATASAEIPGGGYVPHQSSQDFALELRLNYGKPDIDAAPGLTGKPYEQTFGSESRYGLGAEVDWQFLRIPHVGTLGAGVGVGRWASSAKAVNFVDLSPTGDDTNLVLWQFAGLGVLRVDALTHVGIPFVPFAKAGLGYTLWRAYGPNGTYSSRTASGNRSVGASYGFQYSLGLALLLDQLDPSSAKNLDEATGVNNTYLFVEYTDARLQSASSGAALWVGGTTTTAGLTLEF